MKYYIIAGEASGDLHASRLIQALRQKDPDANVRAWGGDLMEKEGAVIVKHYRENGENELAVHYYLLGKTSLEKFKSRDYL